MCGSFLPSGMCCDVRELQVLRSHLSDVTCCDFGCDCILVTGSGDKSVILWGWQPGLGYVELDYSPLKGHKYGVTCVTFSSQGTMLASSSIDGTCVLWNARNGTQVYKFTQVNGDGVRVCRFTPDSRKLVSAGDNGIVCVWDILSRTLIRTIQHHEDSIQSFAFSPDSLLLVTSCNQGLLKIYAFNDLCVNSGTEPLISIDDAQDLGVLCCDFCSVLTEDAEDSSLTWYRLATCGNDQSLKQWRALRRNPSTPSTVGEPLVKKEFVIAQAHSSAVTCVRYSPAGDLLASASVDRTVKLWDMTGTCMLTMDAHARYVNCVGFSRDGSILCTGSNDKKVKIWCLNGVSLTLDSQLVKPCMPIYHFGKGDLEGISAVNEDAVTSKKESVRNVEGVTLSQQMAVHMAAINAIDFNPSGDLLATGSCDKAVKIIRRYPEGFMVDKIPLGVHRYQVNGVAFHGESSLATGSLDGTVALWDTNSNSGRATHSLTSNTAGARCVSSGPGILLVAYDDGTSALWGTEPPSKVPMVVFSEENNAATACACSADGILAACASCDGDLKIYNIKDVKEENIHHVREPIYTLECAHDLGVQAMDFARSLDNIPLESSESDTVYLLATCGSDCLAKIWKIILQERGGHGEWSCTEWRSLTGHGSTVTCARFPANGAGRLATTSTDKQARIWCTYSASCLHVIAHDSLVTCCSFCPVDGLLATGCLSGQLYLWKLPDLQAEGAAVYQPLMEDHTSCSITSPNLITLTEDYFMDLENSSVAHRRAEAAPHHLLCPLTHALLKNAVSCADGFTYEKRAIQEWFLLGGKLVSPMTGQPLLNSVLTPNKSLQIAVQQLINQWTQESKLEDQEIVEEDQALIVFD